MKPLFFLVTLIISLLLVSCPSLDNQNSSRTDGNKSKPKTALDAEALAEYKKLFDNHYVKCGDSYYTELTVLERNETHKYILRFKDYFFHVTAFELSEADRLNGYEWRGGGLAKYTAGRFYEQGKGWSEWQSSFLLGKTYPLEDVFLDKKESAWLFRSKTNVAELKKVNCVDIPQ